MRKFFLLLALVSGFSLMANEKSYPSKVHEVTLFLKGAQLERKVNITLNKGRNTVVLTGLEGSMNANSIVLKGTGSFVIMDYRFEMKYIENKPAEEDKYVIEIKKKIELLQDSMVLHGDFIEDLENKQTVIVAEKNLLLNNPIMQGKSIGDSLHLLEEAVEFLRIRYNEVNEILQELKVKLRAEYKKRDAQTARLTNLQLLLNQRIQETQTVQSDYRLVVSIDAENETQGTLNLSYLIYNAGWEPKYEVYVDGTSKDVKVLTKARIYQMTGLKWENVKLNISTNNPNESKTKPVLHTWWISPYAPAQESRMDAEDEQMMIVETAKGSTAYNDNMAQTPVDYTMINEQMMNRLYEISLAYDVPADGTRLDVQIQKDELKADFRHYLVPSQNRNSFVVARIGNWGKLNFLTNQATVYYDNTMVGAVNVNTRSLIDTLEISLGQDKDIYADRILMEDNTKKTVTGSKKVISQQFEYTIMNRKDQSVKVYLEDQIPKSQNSEIEVSIESKNSTIVYQLNESTGIWLSEIDVPAKGKYTGRLTFQIKYPKEMTVQGF